MLVSGQSQPQLGRSLTLRRRTYLIGIAVQLGTAALCLAVTSYALHFELDRILFPSTPNFKGPVAHATLSYKSASGNELLARRYGTAKVGCVVFFPGQHGANASYDFANHVAAGLAVYFLAYPGQDGAAGRTQLREILDLIGEAVTNASNECSLRRTVFVGASLGSMLAVYASRTVKPAGLVLSSTAPSLSAAIRVRLRSHWISAPLSWLPLSSIVTHDYSLAEGLAGWPDARVVIFQGTDDGKTPIGLLQNSGVIPVGVRLLSIPGGTHSTTFALSQDAQLSSALELIRRESH
jgi:hypothetical protein